MGKFFKQNVYWQEWNCLSFLFFFLKKEITTTAKKQVGQLCLEVTLTLISDPFVFNFVFMLLLPTYRVSG